MHYIPWNGPGTEDVRELWKDYLKQNGSNGNIDPKNFVEVKIAKYFQTNNQTRTKPGIPKIKVVDDSAKSKEYLSGIFGNIPINLNGDTNSVAGMIKQMVQNGQFISYNVNVDPLTKIDYQRRKFDPSHPQAVTFYIRIKEAMESNPDSIRAYR